MNARQKEIAMILLKQTQDITVTDLSKQLSVSKRTIHYDLDIIEQYFLKHHLYIKRKRGRGVCVIASEIECKKMMQELTNQVSLSEEDKLIRQFYIFDQLVQKQQYVTIQELADHFYVSSSSIVNDLKEIKKTLAKPRCVSITTDRTGSYSKGDEIAIQTSMNTFVLRMIKKIYGKLNDETELIDFKRTFYDQEDVEQMISAIQETCCLDDRIGNHYKLNIYIAILTLMERLQEGQHIHHYEQPALLYDELKDLETYVLAEELMQKLCKLKNCSYTEEDVKYLNSLFISIGLNITHIKTRYDERINEMVHQLVFHMSNFVGCHLESDEHLIKSLRTHFKAMIYRNQHGIVVKNPLLDEILKQYSVLYSLIFLAIKEMSFPELKNLSRHEISFLLVYFQASIEKNMTIKKVLVVCPNGIASSELLIFRLKRYLPPLDIVEISSLERFPKMDIRHFDFIISTVALNISHCDVIYISPLLTDEELKKINDYYLKTLQYNPTSWNSCLPEASNTYTIFKEDHLFVGTSFKTSQEVLEFLSSHALENGIAKPGFKENIMHREVIEPTSLWTGVGIPHANPRFVHESAIYCLVNKTPIEWGDLKIRLVFLICISEKDLNRSREIISSIYRIIGSKEKVETFLKLSKTDIITQLKG